MNKYEKLVEYVTNGDDAKAADLFHEIVVAKSRDIYESLMNSENEFGGDQADELINDISSDENGMREGEEEDEYAPEMGGEEEMGGDMDDMGGDMDADDMGGEADLEDRVVDLEDQLDALMAEFNSAMGDEAGEGDMDDMGGEMDDMDDMDGDSTEMSDMPGMMSADEMDGLKNASDEEFEGLWLEMMTEHHKGAVEMAEAEQNDGTNKDAIALADSIIETQQAEISTMEKLLS